MRDFENEILDSELGIGDVVFTAVVDSYPGHKLAGQHFNTMPEAVESIAETLAANDLTPGVRCRCWVDENLALASGDGELLLVRVRHCKLSGLPRNS